MWCLAYLALTALFAVVNQASSQCCCTPCCCMPSCSDGDYSDTQNRDGYVAPGMDEEQQARSPLSSMITAALSTPPGETTPIQEARFAPLPFKHNMPVGMANPFSNLNQGSFGSVFGGIAGAPELQVQKHYEYFGPIVQPQNAVMGGGYPGGGGGFGMGGGAGGMGAGGGGGFGMGGGGGGMGAGGGFGMGGGGGFGMGGGGGFGMGGGMGAGGGFGMGAGGGGGGFGMGGGGGGGVAPASDTYKTNDYSTKQFVNVHSGGEKSGTDGGGTNSGISLSANPTFQMASKMEQR